MSATRMPDAGQVLDELVHQFADPLSFYRELIQNAIDAGSGEIDISIDFQAEKKAREGVCIIHVDDYGEGMNREIIDTRLTRLFSSAKDGDLSKIGRFGIGFVSVFATDPEAVVVDTSRDGENWRVIFHRDKSFSRIERDEPTEGTKIRVIKTMKRKEVEELRKRSAEVVRYWCRHVDIPIRFDGVSINEELELPDADPVIREESEGTRIVVGLSRDGRARYGFYNKGLTLFEGSGDMHAFASFKVDSRHLEHTLTRDNIIRDRHFDRIMERVEKLASVELTERVFAKLERAVEQGSDERERWYDAAVRCIHPAGEARGSWVRTGRGLEHEVGEVDGDDRVAVEGRDGDGVLGVGPECTLAAGSYAAVWDVGLDEELDRNTAVLRLRVMALRPEGGEGNCIIENTVRARELGEAGTTRGNRLAFSLKKEARVRLRAFWHGKGKVRLRRAELEWAAPEPRRVEGAAAARVFRSSAGAPVSVAQAERALERDKVLLAPGKTPLAEALSDEGYLILNSRADGAEARLLRLLNHGAPVQDAWRHWYRPVMADEQEAARCAALGAAVEALLAELEAGVRGVAFGHFRYPGSGISSRVAVAQKRPGELSPREGIADRDKGLFERASTLVINLDHETVATLVELSTTEPETAAYFLVKLFWLRGGITPEIDGALTAAVLRLRDARRGEG